MSIARFVWWMLAGWHFINAVFATVEGRHVEASADTALAGIFLLILMVDRLFDRVRALEKNREGSHDLRP